MLRTQIQTLDRLLGREGVQKNVLHHCNYTSKYPTLFFFVKNNVFLEGST